MTEDRPSPHLTVAVCTHNGAGLLPMSLFALGEQADVGCEWEVLVIDNGSTDGTAEVAEAVLASCEVTYRVVSEPVIGLSNARRRAFEEGGDIVCFVDDDNILEPSYLRRAVGHMGDHPNVGVLGGLGIPCFETSAPPWFDRYQHLFAVGMQAPQSGRVSRNWVYGAGMVVRRAAVNGIVQSGFQSRLSDRSGSSLSSGGDVELGLALATAGWEVSFDDALRFQHFLPASRLSWAYLLRLASGAAGARYALEGQGWSRGRQMRELLKAVRRLAGHVAHVGRPLRRAVGVPRAVEAAAEIGAVRVLSTAAIRAR